MSPFWTIGFRVFYWVIARFAPIVRPIVRRVGLGNVVEVRLVGRRSGRRRDVLLGLLQVDGAMYLGHPNGPTHWTRNLDAAGEATLVRRGTAPMTVRATPLPEGAERNRAIGATWRQHVFPGNVVYWLARSHIRSIGRFYRLEPLLDSPRDTSGHVVATTSAKRATHASARCSGTDP